MVMVANQEGTEVGYLAGRYPGGIGQLYSPGRSFSPKDFLPYALDNGAFSCWTRGIGWDEEAWKRHLLLAHGRPKPLSPLWAVVPDVVANRAATLERWGRYAAIVRSYGYRPAFAVQDGMTFEDVPSSDAVVFLGGTDAFKDAAIAPWCARFPGRVHVARVNEASRLWASYNAGAVSVDGTGWFRNNARAKRTGSNTAGVLLRRFLAETHGRERNLAWAS